MSGENAQRRVDIIPVDGLSAWRYKGLERETTGHDRESSLSSPAGGRKGTHAAFLSAMRLYICGAVERVDGAGAQRRERRGYVDMG